VHLDQQESNLHPTSNQPYPLVSFYLCTNNPLSTVQLQIAAQIVVFFSFAVVADVRTTTCAHHNGVLSELQKRGQQAR
jgi:hypothetical protein